LEQLLGRRVDVVTERGLKPRIRERVLREAVPLWETPRKGCGTSWKRLLPFVNGPPLTIVGRKNLDDEQTSASAWSGTPRCQAMRIT